MWASALYHQQPTPDNRPIAPDVAWGKRERDAMEETHRRQWFHRFNKYDEHPAESLVRTDVPGGWLYELADGRVAPVFVPDPATPHVRDDRRLKLREGYSLERPDDDNTLLMYMRDTDGDVDRAVILEDRLARSFVAYHGDDSWSDHSTLLEAHDALIASGSESPFVVVVGVVPKAKVEGGAA